MWYIKEIMKASVCSFCETIYEYESLEVTEFIEGVRRFINEINLDDCLEACMDNVKYDIKNIDNICNDALYLLERKGFEIKDVLKSCDKAFRKTLYVDNTINIEAFVDNMAAEFRKK